MGPAEKEPQAAAYDAEDDAECVNDSRVCWAHAAESSDCGVNWEFFRVWCAAQTPLKMGDGRL